MIGNLLPDQDSYNIPNINRGVSRLITHFLNSEVFLLEVNLPDYNKMYEKYKNKYIYDKYFMKKMVITVV